MLDKIAFLLLILCFASKARAIDPWYLLDQGQVSQATIGYDAKVQSAEKSKDPRQMWNAYMEAAWFYHQIGNDERAIGLANSALVMAQELNDPFCIGRSLSWLGWSYADLGRYDLGVTFYEKAVSIGAPQGVITHIAVWGMSKQELGYIYMRKGDLEKARVTIEETTNFARDRGISVGVAEGGAHLAELALLQGREKDAETLANEAIQAARDCNCSPLNEARALNARAKALYEISLKDPTRRDEAITDIKQALEHSTQKGIIRFIAEGKILMAKILPVEKSAERLTLVSDALDMLSKYGNEQRGVAQAELGNTFLQASQPKLAAFYLKSGLKLNEEMFRKIDTAYVHGNIAQLEGATGEVQKRLASLKLSADQAIAANATVKALESAETLSKELFDLKYFSLSQEWGVIAIAQLNKILESQNPALTKENLIERKIAITQRLVEIELKLKRAPGNGGESKLKNPAG